MENLTSSVPTLLYLKSRLPATATSEPPAAHPGAEEGLGAAGWDTLHPHGGLESRQLPRSGSGLDVLTDDGAGQLPLSDKVDAKVDRTDARGREAIRACSGVRGTRRCAPLLSRPSGDVTLAHGCAFGKVERSGSRKVSIKEAIL